MRALCKHRHQHEACVASTSSRCDASAKPRLRSAQRAKHKQQQQKRTSVRASAVEDVDIQVFRFTLGIPGFDDTNIPRVVGFLGAALLALNHRASSAVSDAQMRGELIGAALCLLCVALPSIEQRIKAADGGVGRRAGSEAVPGSASGFVFDASLPERTVKELAWASFVVLRHTNSCTLCVGRGDALLTARGALGESCRGSAGGKLAFDAVAAAVRADVQSNGATLQNAGCSGTYLQNRSDMQAAGVASWRAVPSGAKAAFVVCTEGDVWLLALSEFDAGLTEKDARWLRSVAEKMGGVLIA